MSKHLNNTNDNFERRKNSRIHVVAEKIKTNNDDDGEEAVAIIAAELGIDINEWDIQRAHRLDKKKKSQAETNYYTFRIAFEAQ